MYSTTEPLQKNSLTWLFYFVHTNETVKSGVYTWKRTFRPNSSVEWMGFVAGVFVRVGYYTRPHAPGKCRKTERHLNDVTTSCCVAVSAYISPYTCMFLQLPPVATHIPRIQPLRRVSVCVNVYVYTELFGQQPICGKYSTVLSFFLPLVCP